MRLAVRIYERIRYPNIWYRDGHVWRQPWWMHKHVTLPPTGSKKWKPCP